MMTTKNRKEKLFFDPLIHSYLDNPRFVCRNWLADEISQHIEDADHPFVLLTAEPGFGKSVFMAQLARDHPDWPRYFIRRDQRTSLTDVGSHSFLLRIGYQLAARYPELFERAAIELAVEQRIGNVKNKGEVVGAEVARLIASPFHQGVIKVRQHIDTVSGRVVGLRIDELVFEKRLIESTELQYMALIDPARALQRLHPDRQIVILVDALDEVRYHNTMDDLLVWLTNCPDLPGNVRFVLTTRPPDDAVQLFMEKQVHRLQRLNLEDSHCDAFCHRVNWDVETYVDGLLAEPQMRIHLDAQPNGAGRFKAEAIAKADGNLGYLDALARGIDQALSQHDEDTLQALLTLQTLPDYIQGLYAFFLHQIKQRVAKERIEIEDPETGAIYDKAVWPAVHHRMLSVLAVAREPASLEQIQRLGGITAEWRHLTDAAENFSQFLDVINDRYRLYHATLPEFLTDPQTKRSHETQDLYVDPVRCHKRIANHYWSQFSTGEGKPGWSDCDKYGLRHLPAHLVKSNRNADLRNLLLDYDWLQAKLDCLGVNALLDDFAFPSLSSDHPMQRLARFLRQAANVLANDPGQLATRLIGGLSDAGNADLKRLQQQAFSEAPKPWLCPLNDAGLRASAALVRTLQGHRDGVNAVAITPDGLLLISASDDGTLKIWNLTDGRDLRTLEGHTAPVNGVTITNDGKRVISASGDTTLKVWDLHTGQEITSLEGHQVAINDVVVTPDGRKAISASDDMSLKIWSLQTRKAIKTLTGHTGPIDGVAMMPNGGQLISASWDKTLILWELDTGSIVSTLHGHDGVVHDVAINADGRRAVSASWDGTLKVWDLKKVAPIATLIGHSREVHGVALVDSRNWAISGGYDGTVRVWDLKDYRLLAVLEGHAGEVTDVAVLPDEQTAISASADRTLKVWDLDSLSSAPVPKHDYAVWGVAISNDMRRAVTGAGDYKLKVWDIEQGQTTGTLSGHKGTIMAVAITPDGKRVLSASDDHTIKLWDLDTNIELLTFAGHSGQVYGIAVSADGSFAISASEDKSLKIWELETGKELQTLTGHTAEVWDVAIIPGSRAVSASWDGTLRIWDLETGRELAALQAHDDRIWGVAASRDGRFAISASEDATLKLWNLEQKKAIVTLVGHQAGVLSVAMAFNGARAISTSKDGSLKLWNLITGECVATYQANSPLLKCSIGSDNVTIVVGSQSGRVHFLRLMA